MKDFVLFNHAKPTYVVSYLSLSNPLAFKTIPLVFQSALHEVKTPVIYPTFNGGKFAILMSVEINLFQSKSVHEVYRKIAWGQQDKT